jgi:hypothetical protein
VGTVFRQFKGNALANTPGSACYNYNFILQEFHTGSV